MFALFNLIATVITIYIYVLVASAILSWLVAFNVVNTSNRFIYLVGDFLYRVTEPLFSRIRRVLPNFGPLDLSPLVVLLLITAGQILLRATANALLRNGLYF
ncbi:MAG TPA: YggT family protein [Alphaproteobacteria bacterium]|nr:YggT family protein [Alphaproteobacteria bacterium]